MSPYPARARCIMSMRYIMRPISSTAETGETTQQSLSTVNTNIQLVLLKLANTKLDGEDNDSKRRRNALTNALTALISEVAAGRKTIQVVIRMILYAISPPRCWQFFSSQGKSGSMKYNLVTDMPNIYKVLMTAAVKDLACTRTLSLVLSWTW